MFLFEETNPKSIGGFIEMKKEEYIKWKKKTQTWENYGRKTSIKLFTGKGKHHGGFWRAGYSQAITDFVYKYNKKI